jgi:hypothetical protein
MQSLISNEGGVSIPHAQTQQAAGWSWWLFLQEQLYNQYYEVLDDDEWQLLIQGDDTNNKPDRFIYPRKADKWDTRPEIY